MSRPAVFLDRDGTLIADPGYLGKPEGVRLLPGAADAVRRLNEAGFPVILVTNQSGIGRGFYSEADFRAVQVELGRQLAAEGARLDAVYHCPHDPTLHSCGCRKPGLDLFRAAIATHDLDPRTSWWVGDRPHDIEPAKAWGGSGILVAAEGGTFDPEAGASVVRAESLADAVGRILEPDATAAGATEIGAAASAAGAAGAPAASAPVASSASRPLRVVVLASGSGSNLQALIDRTSKDRVQIVRVIGSRSGLRALQRAADAGIETSVLPPAGESDDVALAALLADSKADLVVLAGYLRMVPPSIVRVWAGRMLNVHPALLPAFGGEGMYGGRVHDAVLAAGVAVTGVTVHLVDEQYDRGPIVAQHPVPVLPGDDARAISERVLGIEHKLLPAVVSAVADGSCRLTAEGATWARPLQAGDTYRLDRGD